MNAADETGGGRSGAFVTLEGGEGVGKTTQYRLLVERLEGLGLPVRAVRDPGSTPLGEELRLLLLHPDEPARPVERAELLLYEASRAQLAAEEILPALQRGEIVVCDRFADSTTAYQAGARRLAAELDVASLNLWASYGIVPDLTVLLDLDVPSGLERATASGADRLESEDPAFHEAVRAAFLAIAAEEPDRVKVVDASGALAEVAERVWHHVSALPALGGTAGA